MGENEKYDNGIPIEGFGEGADASTDMQKLKEERDGLYDRLLRKQAEFENYKKRVERERSEYVQFASSELMKELLNALDSFELAIKNAAADSSTNPNIVQGLDLIYKQFQDTMGRFGLKVIDAKGQPFDPNMHQSVSTAQSGNVAENTVVDEFRKGYTLNGRLLRPAMVSVSVRS